MRAKAPRIAAAKHERKRRHLMRLFIKVLAAAAVLSVAFGAAEAKEWKKVRVGTEGAYPPFNFFDSNQQLQGFDIDIAKALCDKMKVECDFVAQDWDGIIPALLANKYDAIIASMTITEERKKTVDFTNRYYRTGAHFVASKSSNIKDVSPGALKGKTLGAQSATTHSSYLEDIYQRAGAQLKLYGTQDEANADLAAGRLDAVLADKIVLLDWLNKGGEATCCQFVGDDIKDSKYFGEGQGIAVRKEDADLKEMFNKAIDQIRADGTYEKINSKYFPFDVYGS
jgi:lysine-arginine-ornithine-binding protein